MLKMATIRRPLRSSVRAFSTNWIEQYRLLPEVLEAEKIAGSKKVIPLLRRAADICANSMPIHHPLAVHALYSLAAGHDRLGEYDESKAILEKLLKGNMSNNEVASCLARALSIVHLKKGETKLAEEV
jgi:tetratricopeptide (TPR) repeat protein